MNAKKKKSGIVYSTDPDFQYRYEEDEMVISPEPYEQKLRVLTDRKQRGGKVVTLVRGFVGSNEDMKALGKLLKARCGVGGSVKDGEIIIQGEHLNKVAGILKDMHFKAITNK